MLPSNAAEWDTAHASRKRPGEPRPGRGRALGAIFIALVLLVGLAGLFVGKLSSGAGAARAAPADAPTQQAIKQIIQRVDDAQAQAVASGDQTIMQDTSTAEFYQRQVRTNQDLLDYGVVQIELLNTEWGAITIDGDTAQATVFETWRTTFDDGTVAESRDRNVYTLVRDNGTWKVQADDHPDATQPTPQTRSAP